MNIHDKINDAMAPWVDSCREGTTLLLLPSGEIRGPDEQLIVWTLSDKLRTGTVYWAANKKLRVWWVERLSQHITFSLLRLS